jgi:hypothetical protein
MIKSTFKSVCKDYGFRADFLSYHCSINKDYFIGAARIHSQVVGVFSNKEINAMTVNELEAKFIQYLFCKGKIE